MADNPWIVRPRGASGDARLRLFCFPYAGGGPSAFRRWVQKLPKDVECCFVQLPGKESRILEPPLRRMTDVLRAVDGAMGSLLDRPFAFFGHSMGGKVAFELARKLRREGRRGPDKLFVSATRAPKVPDPDPPVHHLPDEELVAVVQERYDAIPQDVLDNAELLELVLPGLRADFEVLETHVPADEPPLDCPITCLGGAADSRVDEEALAGWESETSGAFRLHIFDGGHFFIQTREEELLRFLSKELAEILSVRACRTDESP